MQGKLQEKLVNWQATERFDTMRQAFERLASSDAGRTSSGKILIARYGSVW